MRSQVPRFVCLALIALLHSSPNPAQAQASPVDEASALVDRGLDLRVEKRDAEALALFEKAYAMAPTPRALAQIGMAEQALGRWVAAEEHLSAALASKDDPWIRKAMPVLEDGLRVVRTHLGSVQVDANVPGAEVLVNGVVVGTVPMAKPARVAATSALILVRARGYAPVEIRRNVGADELIRETVNLVAELKTDSPGAPAPTAGTANRPSAAPATGAGPGADEQPGSSRKTWGYLAGGVGLASLAATGILAGMAVSKTSGLPQPCQDDPNHGCTPSQGDDINSARGYAGVANITFGVGLVGVGLGTWLLLSSPSAPSPSSARLRVIPEAGAGFGGVRVGGAF